MTDLPENLAEYSAKHRTREHGLENGTVRQTGKKIKKWKGFYHVVVDGKRIKRERIIGECSKMTKTAAREEHRKWIRRLHEEPVAVTRQATVADLCEDYYRLKLGDWSESSQKTNRGLIDNVINPVLGNKPIASATAEELKLFINSMPGRTWIPKTTYARPDGTTATVYARKKKSGCSASYIRKAIIFLRAIFDLASERELIRRNPARSITIKLKVPKATRPPYKPIFPPAQLPALLAQLDQRGSLIVWLSMLGATRPNELLATVGSDVGPCWLHIRKAFDSRRRVKLTKTERPRYVALPPEVAEELHAWIRNRGIGADDLVFQNQRGRAIDSKNFLRRTLRPAAKRAGIAASDIDFRMLRRSYASIWNALGYDIKGSQAQMGHARPDMTASEYMQPIDALRLEQVTTLEKILRGRMPMPVDVAAKLGSGMVQ